MAQQTAVEKLELFFKSHCNPSVCDIEWDEFSVAFLESKQMEKEQIKKAYRVGKVEAKNFSIATMTGEQYYNETYGKQ